MATFNNLPVVCGGHLNSKENKACLIYNVANNSWIHWKLMSKKLYDHDITQITEDTFFITGMLTGVTYF